MSEQAKAAGKGKTKAEANGEAKASKFPMTKAEYAKHAPPAVRLDEVLKGQVAARKDYDSGSVGFYYNEKVTIVIGETPVKYQANIILTAVGSKEAK